MASISALKMKDTNSENKPPEPTDAMADKPDVMAEKSDKLEMENEHVDEIKVLEPEHDKENQNTGQEPGPDSDTDLKIDESAKQPKDSHKKKKVPTYIAEKSLRTRSYVRRRPIPLKRIHEIDIQCGSKSFILQVNNDLEEVVYCGNPELLKCFLSPVGLKISDVNNVLVAGKYQARPRGAHNWEHDYNPAPGSDEEDEEFFDSVKSRKEKEATKAEPIKKVGELEFIKNSIERMKKFKSFKDGIFSKVKEIDSICGCSTFVLIVNLERDCAFYYGSDLLVSQFFTTGLNAQSMLKTHNVRKFETEEIDNNLCCVPFCAVTRNTLSKWRLAAIEQFEFPAQLPLSLHLCPDEDRDQWIAEIDLNPEYRAKVVVCSLHFRDGLPTPENPYPTELLTESKERRVFRGKIPESNPPELSTSELNLLFCQSLIDNNIMRRVNKHIETSEQRKLEEEVRRKEKEEKRKKELSALKGIRFFKFTPLSKKKLTRRRLKRKRLSSTISLMKKRPGGIQKRKSKPRLYNGSSRLSCRFCSQQFSYTKALFHHVRTVHIAPVRRVEKKVFNVSPGERRRILSRLYPLSRLPALDFRKKYVCAVCKSVCDLAGLFNHMKEVHHGLLCQFCLKLFKKVRDLSRHIEVSHRRIPRYYHSMEKFKEFSGSNYSLACGECSSVLSLAEAEVHVCSRLQFDCPWCKQHMETQEQLENHLINGWCASFKIFDALPDVRDIQAVYKVLTGKVLEIPEDEVPPTSSSSLSSFHQMMDTEINSLLEVDIGGNQPVIKAKEPVPAKKAGFSCSDRLILTTIKGGKENKGLEKPKVVLEDIPVIGTIFSGPKSKGISNNIKKEFKDKGRRFDISEEVSSSGNQAVKLDDTIRELVIQKAGKNFIIDIPRKVQVNQEEATDLSLVPARLSRRIARQPVDKIQDPEKPKPKPTVTENVPEPIRKEKPKFESRSERIVRLEFEIKESSKKMRRIIDSYSSCLFCQQCKTVSVDAQFLLSHFHIIHSEDGVNNKLGENAQHCISRIKRYLRDIRRKEILFNYIPPEELFVLEFYRCSYCPTTECKLYNDLFLHTDSAHNTKVLTCNICHNIFLNYGSLISHVCNGPPTSSAARARFACKICHRIDLSSFLDFQTHIRKEHNMCEICFQSEKDQTSLHAHCSSHDQDLMCMKCFVTFEKVDSFRKHMFWKHSSEQSECKSCHGTTWPHVYHFCLPNMSVTCHTCDLVLPTPAAFRVHNRKHIGSTPHPCLQPKCSKSFISKSLLWKHQVRRHPALQESVGKLLYERKLKKEALRFGADSIESVDVGFKIVDNLLDLVWEEIEKRKPVVEPVIEDEPKKEEKKESVLDAAIRSIMPESEDELSKSVDPGNSSALPNPDRDAIQATIAGRSYSEDNYWQAGIDALLAGASVKVNNVPSPSELPPDELLQTKEQEDQEDRNSSETDEDKAPVLGGLWNQDLMFLGKTGTPARSRPSGYPARGGGAKVRGVHPSYRNAQPGGPRMRGIGPRKHRPANDINGEGLKTNDGSNAPDAKSQWDLNLSESSDNENEDGQTQQKTLARRKKILNAPRPLLDHDYCYAAYMMSQEPIADTTEMDKILSNVAFDGFGDGYEQTYLPIPSPEKKRRKKKKKDKKRKRKKKKDEVGGESSDSSDVDVEEEARVDMFGIQARHGMQFPNTPTLPVVGRKSIKIKAPQAPITPLFMRGPKPKYHTPDVAKTSGVTAGTARPSFDTDSSSHGESDIDLSKVNEDLENNISEDEVGSSDLDTDFSAEEGIKPPPEIKTPKPVAKPVTKPTLKLKIKLPPQQKDPKPVKTPKLSKSKKRRRPSFDASQDEKDAKPLSKKMRESLALNRRAVSSEEENYDESYSEAEYDGVQSTGANPENEKLYCYCQCPHDDISEMIGCDAPDCRLEWFHFECVNIMVPPEGKWYCPECTKRYGLD